MTKRRLRSAIFPCLLLLVDQAILCHADSPRNSLVDDVGRAASRMLLGLEDTGARVTGILQLQTASLDEPTKQNIQKGISQASGIGADQISIINTQPLSADSLAIMYQVLTQDPEGTAVLLTERLKTGLVCGVIASGGFTMPCSARSYPRAWKADYVPIDVVYSNSKLMIEILIGA
jgi:hypothetical protein